MEEAVPKAKYLTFRKQRKAYFSRYPVPADVQPVIGKKYLTVQIGGGPAAEIEKQHRKNLSTFDQQIEDARRLTQQPRHPFRQNILSHHAKLTAKLAEIAPIDAVPLSQLFAMIDEWFENWFSNERDVLLNFIDIAIDEKESEYVSGKVQDFKADLHQELHDLHSNRRRRHDDLPHVIAAKQICLDNNIHLREDGKCFKKLSRLMWSILDECHRWELDCLDKRLSTPFYPKELAKLEAAMVASVPQEHIADEALRPKVTISQLFTRYEEYKKSEGEGKISKKIRTDLNTSKEVMVEFLGDKDIKTLTYDDFQLIKKQIAALPPRTGKKYLGKSYGECIKIADKDGDTRRNNYTVNNSLGRIRGAFMFAEETGLIDKCWATNYRFTNNARRDTASASIVREPFKADMLRKIFSVPSYTGCKNLKRRNCPGNHIIHNGYFWVPLIALYTGARLGEICQLHCDQIVEQDKIYSFSITNAKEGQSAKTPGSVRVVPVHSKLLALGLMDYKRNIEPTSQRLFPNLRPQGVSRWFNEVVLKKLASIKTRELVFHSFRHTFATACHEAGLELGIIDALCGWSTQERKFFEHAMRSNYIHKKAPTIKYLKTAIEKVDYGLDLKRLSLDKLRPTRKPNIYQIQQS